MRLECEVSGINCLDHNYTGEATRHTLTLGLLASHANHLSAESGSLRLELRDPAYRQLCSWLNMDSELKKERDDALKELLEMRKWRSSMCNLIGRIGGDDYGCSHKSAHQLEDEIYNHVKWLETCASIRGENKGRILAVNEMEKKLEEMCPSCD